MRARAALPARQLISERPCLTQVCHSIANLPSDGCREKIVPTSLTASFDYRSRSSPNLSESEPNRGSGRKAFGASARFSPKTPLMEIVVSPGTRSPECTSKISLESLACPVWSSSGVRLTAVNYCSKASWRY